MTVTNIYRATDGKAPSQFRHEAEGWDMCLDALKSKGVKINEKTWQSDLPILVFRLITHPVTKKVKRGYLCFIEDNSQSSVTPKRIPNPTELFEKVKLLKQYLANLEAFIRDINSNQPRAHCNRK